MTVLGSSTKCRQNFLCSLTPLVNDKSWPYRTFCFTGFWLSNADYLPLCVPAGLSSWKFSSFSFYRLLPFVQNICYFLKSVPAINFQPKPRLTGFSCLNFMPILTNCNVVITKYFLHFITYIPASNWIIAGLWRHMPCVPSGHLSPLTDFQTIWCASRLIPEDNNAVIFNGGLNISADRLFKYQLSYLRVITGEEAPKGKGKGKEKGTEKFHYRTGNEAPKAEQRYICALSLTSAVDGGGCSTSRFGRFTHANEPVPTLQEAGWFPGPVWTGTGHLGSIGIRCPDRPARSESPYRLSYPGP